MAGSQAIITVYQDLAFREMVTLISRSLTQFILNPVFSNTCEENVGNFRKDGTRSAVNTSHTNWD
jgi:hypothetical protein